MKRERSRSEEKKIQNSQIERVKQSKEDTQKIVKKDLHSKKPKLKMNNFIKKFNSIISNFRKLFTEIKAHRKSEISNIRKYLGYIFLCVGLLLIVYGIPTYLNGPIEDENVVLERSYNKVVEIEPMGYFSINYFKHSSSFWKYDEEFYWTEAPSLIVERKIDIQVEAEDDKGIDLYLINSEQAERWENSEHREIAGDIIKIGITEGVIEYRLKEDDSYYKLLLINNQDSTIAVLIDSKEYTIVQTFNYNNAFKGFRVALVGWIMILLTSFLGNPLDVIHNKIIYIIKFPDMEEYYVSKKRTTPNFITIFFGIVTLICVLIYIWTKPGIHAYPSFFIPVMKDWIIRFLLFIILIYFVLEFVIFIIDFLKTVFQGVIFWFFGVRRRQYKYNPKFEELQYSIIIKELKSPLALFIYAVIAILCYGILHTALVSLSPLDTKTIAIFLVFVPFSLLALLIGYKSHISFYKACRQLNLEYDVELENQSFLTATSLIPSFFFIIFSLIISMISLRILIEPIFEMTVSSSIIGSKVPSIHQLISDVVPTTLPYLKKYIFNMWTLYAFFCALGFSILVFYYFSLIGSSSFEISKKRKKKYFAEAGIFLFVFIFIQTLSIVHTGSINWIALPVSFAIAFIADMLRMSLETLIKS